MGSKPSKAYTDTELYAKYGVLVPPIFAIEGNSSLSSAEMTLHHFQALLTSAFRTSETKLNEHAKFMKPSLVIQASPYLNDTSVCDSALKLSMKSNDEKEASVMNVNPTSTSLTGVFISNDSKSFLQSGIGGTFSNNNSNRSYAGGYIKFGDAAVFTKVSGDMKYTAGARYARTIWDGNARMAIGSTWSLSRQNNYENLRSLLSSVMMSSRSSIPMPMYSWLALQMSDDSMFCAVEAHSPNCLQIYNRELNTQPLLSYSYMLSMDLNKISGAKSLNEDSNNARTPPPPLKFNILCDRTGSNSNGTLSVSVSQQISFDRTVSNPIETRCPKIRNVLAWSVETKKELAQLSSSVSKNNQPSSLNASLCWQINRGLACKLNVDDDGVHSGLIFKRWAHPMITCTLLSGVKKNGQPYQGVGLVVETTPVDDLNQQAYPEKPLQSSDTIPKTKQVLDLGNGSAVQVSRRRSYRNIV